MKKLRNEVTYAVACACEGCRKESGRDFEIIGFLNPSLQKAKKDLKSCKNSHHESVFLVRETLEPVHQIPQQKSKKRKAA